MNDILRGVKVVVFAVLVLVAGLVALTLVGAVVGRQVKAAQGGWRFFKVGSKMR